MKIVVLCGGLSMERNVSITSGTGVARALREHQVLFEMHIWPHGPHGLGLGFDVADVRAWGPLSADWMSRNGKGCEPRV